MSRAHLPVLGFFSLLLGAPSVSLASVSGVQPPALYDSFLPPAIGASYTDSVFGTTIKRLSDAVHTSNNAGDGKLTFISTEFSTASPFNSDSSFLLLQHQSYFGLYTGEGVYLRDLPFAVNASAEPRWSRTDPNILFYVRVNQLMRLNVVSGVSFVVRTFAEYGAIRGRGESEISLDGDHFVFAADEVSQPGVQGVANRYVFVYTISTNTKGAVLDTIGHDFDDLYIAPDNSVAIGWLQNGASRFTGVELFDQNMAFKRQLTRAIGHMHLTTDTNGDALLIWTNSGDPQPIQNCQNAIVKVRLSDAKQTCLLQLHQSLAVHITAPDGNGWAFLETYAPQDPSPNSPAWAPYTNEVLQVKLDGTEVRRLVHHRSRPLNDYNYQPRAVVNRQGNRLVFSSNFNLQRIASNPKDYSDAYLLAVPIAPPPRLSISDAVAFEGQSGTTSLVFTVTLSRPSDQQVTVSYATISGTASDSSDYIAIPSTTLVLASGETQKTIAAAVLGDIIAESNESLGLFLSSPVNAAISRGLGVGTILDDDSQRTDTTPFRTQAVWQEFFAVDSRETPFVADLDGDRRGDLITFTRDNPNAVGDVYVALSLGAAFGASAKWHDWFGISRDEAVLTGDFDGDGRSDVATWLASTSRQVYVARSTGNGLTTEAVWSDGIGSDSSDVVQAGDVNGDGKVDLVLFARTQGKVYVALSNGIRFSPPLIWHGWFAVSPRERPRLADVNGDGMIDIVTFATDSPTAFGDVYVATSNGQRFVDLAGNPDSSNRWHDWFAVRPEEEIRIGDSDGDGKDDFFSFLPHPFAQCYVVRSNGSSLGPNELWPENVVELLGQGDVVRVGDVDGDGKADVIVFAQKEGRVYVSLSR